MLESAAPGAGARTMPSRWVALAILCGSMLMIILDGTIVSVALPSIESDLRFAPADLAWTVNAYLVPLGGLLLLSGRLGDLYGRRRVLLVGLVVFVLASLLCAFAVTAVMLIVARFAQGVGAALASAVVLGMIVTLFPEPGERARALGAYSFVGAAGASIGLVLGGVLTSAFGWRSIFLVNVPIGVVAVALSLWAVAPDRTRERMARPDALGGVLVTAGLTLGVLAIVTTAVPFRLGAGVLAIALLTGFVVRQLRAPEPLVRLSILRSRAVSGGNVVQLLTVAGMLGFQFVMAIYLQQALGYSPAATGFAVLPVSLLIGAVSLTLAGRLIVRFGARRLVLGGLVLLGAGLLLLARDPAGSYVVDVLPSAVILGLGAGLVIPAVMTIIMSDATPEDAGLASGLANTSQQVGGALGTAVLAAVAAARTEALGGGPGALLSGFHLAFQVSALLVAAALVVTAVVLRGRAR